MHFLVPNILGFDKKHSELVVTKTKQITQRSSELQDTTRIEVRTLLEIKLNKLLQSIKNTGQWIKLNSAS